MNYDTITRLELEEAADFLSRNFAFINHCELVIQLGSGQTANGLFDEEWGRCQLLDFPFIPDEPSIAQTSMEIIWGLIDDTRVLVYCGRFHMYEGYGRVPVLLPIWSAIECGAQNLLICNAAGGIAEELQPGSFMLVDDHINNLGTSAIAGHQHLLRSAYIDMSEVYSTELRSSLMQAAEHEEISLHRGIYWANIGPQFETPAETQLAHLAGAGAVGSSTVMEATIAHALGARVVGLSMITNRATGLSDGLLSHEETIARGASLGRNLTRLIRRWVHHEAKGAF